MDNKARLQVDVRTSTKATLEKRSKATGQSQGQIIDGWADVDPRQAALDAIASTMQGILARLDTIDATLAGMKETPGVPAPAPVPAGPEPPPWLEPVEALVRPPAPPKRSLMHRILFTT